MSQNSDMCVFCQRLARPRQEGLQCDKCQGWQHRACNTEITRSCYCKLCKGKLDLEWFCEECKKTVAVNSLIGFAKAESKNKHF